MTSDSDGTKKKADRREKPRRNEKGDMLKMYEKNRRDRFNIKIELLASLLPNYNKENPWPKQEIISNSIEFISSKKGESLRSLELLRSMKIEIEKLKDVILAYTEFKYQKYDIHKLSSVEIKSILKQLSENNNRMCDQPPIQTPVQPPIQTLVPIQSQIPVSSQPTNKSRLEASQSNLETNMNSEQVGSLGGFGGSGSLGGPNCSSKTPMIINVTQSSLPTSQHFGQNSLIVPNPPTVQNPVTVQQILVYSQPSLQTSLVNQSINQSLKPILLQAVSSVGLNKPILLERGLSHSQPRPIQIQQIQGTSVIAPKLIQPRSDNKYVLQGSQLFILPGPMQVSGSTSTVTMNTGSKSSVMFVHKRPYTSRKRKLKEDSSPSVVKSTRSNPSSSSNPTQEAIVPSVQETSVQETTVQETTVQETTVQPAQDDNVQRTEVHINDVVQPTEPGSNVHALTDVQNSIVQTSSVATCTSQQTNPDVQDSTVQAPMPDSVHTSSVSVQNGDVQALTSVQESSVGELSNCTEVHDYILPDVQLQLEQVEEVIEDLPDLASVVQEEEDEHLPQEEEDPADDEQKSDSTGAESRSDHAEIKQQSEHAQDSNNGAARTHDSRHAPEHKEDAQLAEDGEQTQHARENRHDSEHADEVRHAQSIGQQSYTQDIFTNSQVIDDDRKLLENNDELNMINETINEDNCVIEVRRGKCAKDEQRILRRGEKKNKNSYSIPALCQISVNIGSRPDISSSPGVLSLNSVGTLSPSSTPTPDKTCQEMSKNPEDHVIEELKTIRPEELLQQVEIVTGQEDKSNSNLSLSSSNISPSQTYLTSFPLLSKHCEQDDGIQQEISQALRDLDRELKLQELNTVADIKDLKDDSALENVGEGLDRKSGWVESMDRKVGWVDSLEKMDKMSPCSGSGQQSVYDFSCKPSSPVVPLNKSRKDLRSPRQTKEEKSTKLEEISNLKPEPKLKPGEKKSSPSTQPLTHSGYTNQHLGQNYDKRLLQEGGRGSQNSTSGTQDASRLIQDTRGNQSRQYSNPTTTYHPGTQHSIPRHTYMTPHYQYHQVGVPGAPGVPNQQTNSYPHHSNSYSHVPVTEMKNVPSFHQDSKYSCSTHSSSSSSSSSYPPSNLQDFNSRNYYKDYAAPNQNYRYQNDQQHYIDRKQRQHQQQQQQQQQQLMDPVMEKVEADTSAAFSVTQLVNTTQRKNAKKPSSATKSRGKAEEKKEKEEKKGGKGGSRRSRSGNRSNYSTESLLTAQVQIPPENKDDKYRNSPVKNSSPKVSNYLEKMSTSSVSSSRSNTTWSNEMNQHFGSLPFSSLSPSPGLFSTDISSFELGIFNPQEGLAGGREYFSAPAQSKSSKQLACQLTNQRSDWGLNSGNILDTSFLPPLPTLTPPTDESMAYSFMTHSHSGFYPCSSGPMHRPQNVYTSHTGHIPTSGCTAPSSMMSKGVQQPFHQMPGLKNSATGSLVNFNLSTIFPEINISAPGANCQSKPLVGLPSLPAPEFLQGSRTTHPGVGSLPHSISLIGQTSHQANSFSVGPGIGGNMVPGLPFPNLQDQ